MRGRKALAPGQKPKSLPCQPRAKITRRIMEFTRAITTHNDDCIPSDRHEIQRDNPNGRQLTAMRRSLYLYDAAERRRQLETGHPTGKSYYAVQAEHAVACRSNAGTVHCNSGSVRQQLRLLDCESKSNPAIQTGYNPTFDLWSTADVTTAANAADQNRSGSKTGKAHGV